MGGWGSATFQEGFSSSTVDGGTTWQDANEIGRFINRFRFFHEPTLVGYASGRTVYRYSTELVAAAREIAPPEGLRLLTDNTPRRSAAPVQAPLTVPEGADRLRIDIWDRFGEHVRQLVDERAPAAGSRTVNWNLTDDTGVTLEGGSFLLRVTVDDRSESQIVYVTR